MSSVCEICAFSSANAITLKFYFKTAIMAVDVTQNVLVVKGFLKKFATSCMPDALSTGPVITAVSDASRRMFCSIMAAV